MAGLKNNGSKKQTTGNDVQEEVNLYEDEINLIDYFFVLWKHKRFVLLGSALPTLIVGLAVFFLPQYYTIIYTYYDVAGQFSGRFAKQPTMNVSNWNLNERNYNMLITRFYSEENLSRIIARLQPEGLCECTGLAAKSGERRMQGLEDLVQFEVLPPYVDLTKIEGLDPAILEDMRQLEAQLLNVTVTTSSKEDIHKILPVIRGNIETVISMYLVAEQLNVVIRHFKAKIADIEEGKFSLQLSLEKSGGVLSKLTNIETETSGTNESDIMLQFDVGGRSEYLPIEYQIQAAQSAIIQLEETIEDNEKKCGYYSDLVDLNEKLLAEAKDKLLSDYTIQQFHSFLLELRKGVEKQELKDYLSSYVKGIENRIAVSTPVTEHPGIHAVPKGTVKIGGIVFAIAVMLSVFVSFLLEGLERSRAQTS